MRQKAKSDLLFLSKEREEVWLANVQDLNAEKSGAVRHGSPASLLGRLDLVLDPLSLPSIFGGTVQHKPVMCDEP